MSCPTQSTPTQLVGPMSLEPAQQFERDNRDIEVEFDPYAPAESAWSAIDRRTYGGDASQVGRGESPETATADLKERLAEADDHFTDDRDVEPVRDERAALMVDLDLREGDFR